MYGRGSNVMMRTMELLMVQVQLTAAVAAALIVANATADSRQTVHFQVEAQTVFGESIYVLGDIPELGGGNPAYALKLEPSAYPLWRAAVAIPWRTQFTYQYTLRDDSVPQWSNPANHNPFGDVLAGETKAASVFPPGKGLYYHSGWQPPTLHWREDGGVFVATPMVLAGAGRNAGEWRWRAVGVGTGCREFEFYFTDGGNGRDPVSGSYKTRLDAFFVQDGQLYTYTPPAVVGPPLQTNFGTFPSAALGENRPHRVLLPRGYAQNPTRRYPVLYTPCV